MAYNEITKSIAVKKTGKVKKRFLILNSLNFSLAWRRLGGISNLIRKITFKLLALPEYSPSPDARTHWLQGRCYRKY